MSSKDESVTDNREGNPKSHKDDVVLASDRDKEIFFSALNNPAKPNENLKKAAKEYNLFLSGEKPNEKTIKAILDARTIKKPQYKNTTDFLIDSGLSAAAMTLADRKVFNLNEEQWESFNNMLDADAHEKPKLKRLLTTPSIFDQ